MEQMEQMLQMHERKNISENEISNDKKVTATYCHSCGWKRDGDCIFCHVCGTSFDK